MNRRQVSPLILAGFAVLAVPRAGSAKVFEIAEDGSVHTRSDAAAVAWSGEAPVEAGPDDGAAETAPEVPAAAFTPGDMPAVPTVYASLLRDAARRYDVSPSLLAALVWRESAWQPSALSKKGAIGLAQLMPATARALAVDPRDAAANLDGAAHYLRQMLDLFDGDVERALAAYNAGPKRVLQANGVPPIRETRTYVSAIIDRLALVQPVNRMGEDR